MQAVGGYLLCINYFTPRCVVVCVCLWLFVALSGFYDFFVVTCGPVCSFSTSVAQ